MRAYYNEFNPEAAAMLRQLIADGLCAPGDVDERSITEVRPDDLRTYTQCHFFAGIGGWSIALRLAGWPDDRPVWTGSAPCQPFSSAGRQKGKDDSRHLLPTWLGLIKELRPATIFGEQVATAVAHGWLDDVYQGLEAEGYAVGAAVLPACSVGAPHRRERLYFVANSTNGQFQVEGRGTEERNGYITDSEINVANTDQAERWRDMGGPQSERGAGLADIGDIMGNTSGPRGEVGLPAPTCGCEGKPEEPHHGGNRSRGFWHGAEWQPGWDGKARFIEPSIPLLADGIQHRRPLLHALGNAIVPQVAAEFIRASQG